MNKHYKTLTVVTITGNMAERNKALDFVYDNGYRTCIVGPMPVARFRYDTSRFRIVAEKRKGQPQVDR